VKSVDVIVIGGGIVGLAAAYNLTRKYPHKKVTLLEKEPQLAAHQTGHNSGVLHSGIYYKPGSLKAALCREGKLAMERFCEREQIAYRRCGKVIVAIDESELARLEELCGRGRANGVSCDLIKRARLLEIEPHAAGIKAIHVPETGIIDFRQVARRLGELIEGAGGSVVTGARVTAIREGAREVVIDSSAGVFSASHAVNCAGLHSDRVANLGGGEAAAKIVPFRGEYFKLKEPSAALCNGLIYPVPDPRFPFLGVHVTRMIDGNVECGPSAVLALAREGYRKTDVDYSDLLETITYPGFVKLAARYWKMGAVEMWRSLNKRAFAAAARRLVPEIKEEDMEPAEAGVRAQAVARDGSMLDDFAFQERPRTLHVINAPSPAATASLAIGRVIVERLAERF
jgi:(S)-2-hydroxyglutarate dehydrogenase